MEIQVGKQSLAFAEAPYIISSASIVGKKEGEGPLGNRFDVVGEDDKFGQNTWEEAESTLQKEAFTLAVGKAGLKTEDIRYLFSGDLLGQNIATSFGLMDYQVPLFGLYGACSTCGEALSLGAMCVAAGYADYVVAMTSSHFASAEKQFRYPLEYANQRPLSATWTVTGGGAYILGKKKSPVRIAGITTGRIVDYGIKDSMNMGAAMAPAAADTLANFFADTATGPENYDLIVTGDLSAVGSDLLRELLDRQHIDLGTRHADCGLMIYDRNKQDVHAGGSGCGCSASVLCSYLLGKMERRELNNVLFVATGALMSPTSSQQGESIPGIAHLVHLVTQ